MEKNREKKSKGKWWLWVIIALVVIGSLGSPDDSSKQEQPSDTPPQSQTSDTSKQDVVAPVAGSSNLTVTPEPAPAPAPAPAPEKPQMTMGQKNALESAQSYLEYTAFSRTDLIEQLVFEGYSTDEATFAVDNCVVDWNEQAAISAQDYLDLTSFSRQELIEQLVFDGYTQEQAEYGVTAVGY